VIVVVVTVVNVTVVAVVVVVGGGGGRGRGCAVGVQWNNLLREGPQSTSACAHVVTTFHVVTLLTSSRLKKCVLLQAHLVDQLAFEEMLPAAGPPPQQ